MKPVLADAILVLHSGIVLFIASGYLLIPLGAWRGWHWVRVRGLRLAHLAAIVYVAAQAALGQACPLTIWESRLRGTATDGPGFIERWVGALIYWDLPTAFFTALYVVAALAALALWWGVPPRRNERLGRAGDAPRSGA